MTKWQELYDRFLRIKNKTGGTKATSFEMKVWWDAFEGIDIYLGTYDIGDWPRHTRLGPFDSEIKALEALEAKILEAEKAVSKANKSGEI